MKKRCQSENILGYNINMPLDSSLHRLHSSVLFFATFHQIILPLLNRRDAIDLLPTYLPPIFHRRRRATRDLCQAKAGRYVTMRRQLSEIDNRLQRTKLYLKVGKEWLVINLESSHEGKSGRSGLCAEPMELAILTRTN